MKRIELLKRTGICFTAVALSTMIGMANPTLVPVLAGENTEESDGSQEKVPAEMIREALTKAVPEVEVPKEAAVAPVVPVKAALEAEVPKKAAVAPVVPVKAALEAGVPKNPAVAPEIPAAVPKVQAAVRPRVQAAVRKIPETTRHKMPEEVLPAITVVPELEALSL